MNDALIKNQAVPGRIARLVQHGVVACVLACSAAGAMAAGQDRNSRRDEMQQPVRERYDSRAQDARYEQRAFEMREDVRRQQEQAMRDQQSRDERRGGRMTPDERRDLRRQINEANADLYQNPRRR